MSEWTRSCRCEGGACVEVREVDSGVEVRDGKDPNGPRLRFTHAEWEAFVGGILDGDLRFSSSDPTTV